MKCFIQQMAFYYFGWKRAINWVRYVRGACTRSHLISPTDFLSQTETAVTAVVIGGETLVHMCAILSLHSEWKRQVIVDRGVSVWRVEIAWTVFRFCFEFNASRNDAFNQLPSNWSIINDDGAKGQSIDEHDGEDRRTWAGDGLAGLRAVHKFD